MGWWRAADGLAAVGGCCCGFIKVGERAAGDDIGGVVAGLVAWWLLVALEAGVVVLIEVWSEEDYMISTILRIMALSTGKTLVQSVPFQPAG